MNSAGFGVEFATLFGTPAFNAQIRLLLRSFRSDWSMSLPTGWIVTSFQPYFYPNANLGFVFPTAFIELLLPVWLLVRGWTIQVRTSPALR